MPRQWMAVTAAIAVLAGFVSATAQATVLINDDFSTYSNGNLIGAPNAAGGWVQTGSKVTVPLQVSSGKVVIPTPQTGDNQDAFKTFGTLFTPPVSGSTSIYAALDLKVNTAPTIGSGGVTSSSYFFALDNAADGSGFDNDRVAAIDNSANVPNTYLLQARVTGQTGSPFFTGTTPLLYGTTYNVVMEAVLTAVGTDEFVRLYVNPTNGNQAAQTAYLTAPINTGSPLTGIGGVVISQFQSATVGISGVEIGGLRAATTFSEASNLAVPEPSSIAMAVIGGTLLTWRRLRRRK